VASCQTGTCQDDGASLGLLNARIDYDLPDLGATAPVLMTNVLNKKWRVPGAGRVQPRRPAVPDHRRAAPVGRHRPQDLRLRRLIGVRGQGGTGRRHRSILVTLR